MKKTRSFLLAAGIMLALAFTLSCSDDKNDGGGSSNSGGGGSNSGSFTVDFIYNRNTMTCNDDSCSGEKWIGNGTVRMEACDDDGLYAGEIVNGTLSLNLPSTSEIPQSCFFNATQVFEGASVSPSDVKIAWGDYDFDVDGIGNDGNPYNVLKFETPAGWQNATERVRGRYFYFSKAARITGGDYNINASEGWNEVYFTGNTRATTDLSTIGGIKPIWYIYFFDDTED